MIVYVYVFMSNDNLVLKVFSVQGNTFILKYKINEIIIGKYVMIPLPVNIS